jgi:ferredoxin--NADP+ reductase
VLEDAVREVSDETYVMTDDSTAGQKGLVTENLKELWDAGKVNYVLAVGPVPMMRAVANLTSPHHIKTMVSLNSIMVDGTGMCGGCRVLVNNSGQFACVDGPEFDAHRVYFAVLVQRNSMYHDAEQRSLAEFHRCRTEAATRELEHAVAALPAGRQGEQR